MAFRILLVAVLLITYIQDSVCETPVKIEPATINGAIVSAINATFQEAARSFMGANTAYTVTSVGALAPDALADVSNGTVDFAITQNSAPSLDTCGKGQVTFPLFIGIGAVFHSIPAPPKAEGKRPEVKLDACTLGSIFMGKTAKWNDPSIVKLNPALKADASKISVIVRVSSTTKIPLDLQFKKYIMEGCPLSADGYTGATLEWPSSPSFIRVSEMSDVVAYLRNTSYAIAFLEADAFKLGTLGSEVAIENRNTQYVTSNTAQMPSSVNMPLTRQQIQPFCWGDLDTTYMQGKNVHPLTYLVYFTAPSYNKTKSPAAVAAFAKHWLSFGIQSGLDGQGFKALTPTLKKLASAAADELGNPPVPQEVIDATMPGGPIPDIPDDKKGLPKVAIISIAAAIFLAVAMVAATVAYFVVKKRRASREREQQLSQAQPQVGDVHMVDVKIGENTV